jgi:prephenate dehydrogenase
MIRKIRTSQPPFPRIAIIGVGLIGGSLGLAIKKRWRSVRVVGVDKPSVLRRARLRGAIDEPVRDLSRAVNDADLVVVAAPIAASLKLLPTLGRLVRPTTLVTDVGSVKTALVDAGAKHFASGNFIGGHPMAGVEHSGIDAAHPLLFENAVYVLTPTRKTSRVAVRRLGSFLGSLGARVMVLDASTHDRVAAAVSHVPQLLAVSLMNATARKNRASRNRMELAAGGFRDLTRIASSPFEVWKDILRYNSRKIDAALDIVETELRRLRAHVRSSRTRQLNESFRSARKLRNAIPRNMKGFLHSLVDLYVFVEDKPGVLATITGTLAKNKINIKDMELMKIREGSGGTFRLSFESREVAQRAARILRKRGFEVEG